VSTFGTQIGRLRNRCARRPTAVCNASALADLDPLVHKAFDLGRAGPGPQTDEAARDEVSQRIFGSGYQQLVSAASTFT
jgi:hypothetical protein